ncbi:DUF4349 domain-containing protein [Streptomyces pratensis]|uniref:DUF4349 domain-containing protein n=1 Tax=Streptomyces pratensis TaxID=1169025 RepID=UPI0019314616|nr:DUF4349 domain-containing protein [Streptomyces pratensis]
MQYERHTEIHPPVRPVRRRAHALTAAGLLVALLTTGACAASDDNRGQGLKSASDDKAAAPAAAGAGAGEKSAARSADGPSVSPETASSLVTHVIHTATLELEVKDVAKAVAVARSAVTKGLSLGRIEEETTERLDESREGAHLVLRVPQNDYGRVLDELAGSGKVLSRTSNAKDVTGEVVDVESRIATQRASVARIRDLMDKAEKLTDVVTLEGELSSRQADLESLLARQESLKNRTTFATITLELSEPYEDGKDPEEDTGFLDALAGGWDAFVTMLRWIMVAIGATAPFLAAAAVLVLVWRLLRSRLPQRRTTPQEPSEAPQAPPAA